PASAPGERWNPWQGYVHIVRRVVRAFREEPVMLQYLIASAIYRDGLGAVFSIAGVLAANAYGFSTEEIIVFGIAANLIAGIGVYLGGKVDDRVGPRPVIIAGCAGIIVLGLVGLFLASTLVFWIAGLAICPVVGPRRVRPRRGRRPRRPPPRAHRRLRRDHRARPGGAVPRLDAGVLDRGVGDLPVRRPRAVRLAEPAHPALAAGPGDRELRPVRHHGAGAGVPGHGRLRGDRRDRGRHPHRDPGDRAGDGRGPDRVPADPAGRRRAGLADTGVAGPLALLHIRTSPGVRAARALPGARVVPHSRRSAPLDPARPRSAPLTSRSLPLGPAHLPLAPARPRSAVSVFADPQRMGRAQAGRAPAHHSTTFRLRTVRAAANPVHGQRGLDG